MSGPAGPLHLDRLDAVVFDTDGVLTDTASVHAAAWKGWFDGYLEEQAARLGEPAERFTEADYLRHVDGRPRSLDGVAAFLASRGVTLPLGRPGRPAGPRDGLRARQHQGRPLHRLPARPRGQGVPELGGAGAAARAAGVRTAVVSASRNMVAVLSSAGLRGCSTPRSTGSRPSGWGWPASPTRRCSWRRPGGSGWSGLRAAVVEDALAGVEAGRRGGFGLVIGVDRTATRPPPWPRGRRGGRGRPRRARRGGGRTPAGGR